MGGVYVILTHRQTHHHLGEVLEPNSKPVETMELITASFLRQDQTDMAKARIGVCLDGQHECHLLGLPMLSDPRGSRWNSKELLRLSMSSLCLHELLFIINSKDLRLREIIKP